MSFGSEIYYRIEATTHCPINSRWVANISLDEAIAGIVKNIIE